ncbi:sodium/glutamate symporter [Stappia taiwanensis]|uniref:Sodium/glutamate symporter n=1 Tax=Stappia taiwanensis TaxID=992267 RepID=A0A838XZS8_9HYPH|nr:sodium/glutamate symporter [Stappia taiwanensis]MBA4612240.1 sodium/glutamate symporter [Stappia taiwanensis]GGE92466.1 glutamate permease [Stappia taiwanensis]
MSGDTITIGDFASFNLAIIVYFLGIHLNRTIPVLNRYNIPEPVSGGMLVASAVLVAHLSGLGEITFSLAARDFLLLYFFTSIGLNARLGDLVKGGLPLVILLGLTIGYMVLQNIVAVTAAAAFGQPIASGLIGGTVSLIGGHGTAIAWGPTLTDGYGVTGAIELGAATATLGLITASLLGGPIASYLIDRKGAVPGDEVHQVPTIGLERDEQSYAAVTHTGLMGTILVLNLAIALGAVLQEALAAAGLDLPLFVVCLFSGILLSNTVPEIFPTLSWPARSRSLAVVSDLALGIFLSMSLMSLQLWTIAGLAGPMLVTLAAQVAIAALFILFVVFPLMGRDYEAAVLSAGYAGFALGATPTAIANMTAVTKHFGAAPRAFLILPLVAAFFTDLANAIILRLFLTL